MPTPHCPLACLRGRVLKATGAALLLGTLAACGGSEPSTAPATITPNVTYTYSAWRITPGTIATTGTVTPADTSNAYIAKARTASTEISTYWSTPPVAPRVRTLWVLPVISRINGDNKPVGLYVSDSLPGTGQGGSDPTMYLIGSTAASTGFYDDPALEWSWSLSGTPPANATVNAQYQTTFPGAYVAQPCLGQDVAPYVHSKINFVGAGTAGTGTITYTFRAVKASCLKPRALSGTWQLVIPFTATRVR